MLKVGLENQIKELLNEYSEENTSNTPDFILASFLIGCLKLFNTATKKRIEWYGIMKRGKAGTATKKKRR